MNADGRDGIYVLETEQIIGSAFSVINSVGHGFREKIYENALVVDFGYHDIPFLQQPSYPIHYREVKVGEFIPDLIVFEKVVVDTKLSNESPITRSAKCSTTSASPVSRLALS